MKKLLLLLSLSGSTYGWQYFDFEQMVYYTLPEDPTINQDEYHIESCVVAVITRDLINNGTCKLNRMLLIDEHLRTKNTPEALRLLSDLEAMEK